MTQYFKMAMKTRKLIQLSFTVLLFNTIFQAVCGLHLKCFWCHSSKVLRNLDCEKVDSKTNLTGDWCKVETHNCYTFNTTHISESVINVPFLERGCIGQDEKLKRIGRWEICRRNLCNHYRNDYIFTDQRLRSKIKNLKHFFIFGFLFILNILWEEIETIHLPIDVLESFVLQSTMFREYRAQASCIPLYWMGLQNCHCWHRGVCQEKNSKQCTCCVEDIYKKPSKNCSLINYCAINLCKNDGSCMPVVGSYFCICVPPFHGRNCEKDSGEKRVKRISEPIIAYPIMNSLNKCSFLFFLVFDGEIGDNFTFTIKIDDLTYMGDDTHIDHDLALDYASKTTWPMTMPKVGKNVLFVQYLYPPDVDQPTYTVEAFVQLNNSGEEQFSAKYNMFMMPHKEDDCISAIEMDGCSHSNTNVMKIPRGKDYTVHGLMYVRCDEGRLSFMWCICNLTNNTPFPFMPGTKQQLKLSKSNKTHNCEDCHHEKQPQYKFSAFTMTYGIYAIMLTMQSMAQDPQKEKISRPLDVCFLRIVADPIIAELAGGSAKIMDNTGDIILDATRSRDPNEYGDIKNHLIFEWSCEPREHEFCSKITSVIYRDSYLTLKPVPGNYTFTVRVSVDKEKAPTIGTYPEETLPEPGIATQVITVVERNIPKPLTHLAITCVKNCETQVNSNEIFYIKVTCNKYCVDADKQGYYHWTVGENEIEENNTQSGLDDDKLIINSNVLIQGRNYTIKVMGGNEGIAYLNITIRSSLQAIFKDKKCNIKPFGGISGIDVFNITCDYPATIHGFPLRFELFQTPDLSKPLTEILITYSSKIEMENLLLSAGSYKHGYATELNIRIEDRFAEFTKQKIATIVVKSITETHEYKNISEAVRRIMAGDNGRPSLANYVTQGDMSGAVSLISALTIALDSSNMSDKDVWEIKKTFVAAIDQIPLYHDAPVRQVAAVLHLVTGAGEKYPHIPPQSVRDISDILDKITSRLCFEINDSYVEFEVSTEELMNVSVMVLESVHTLLSSMNMSMAIFTEVPTVAVETEEGEELPTYSEYYELDPQYYDAVRNFKETSKHIVLCLENLGKSLLHRLEKEEMEKLIETKYISIWVKIDRPINFKGQFIGNGRSRQGFKFSEELVESLQNQTEHIGVQVTISAENPFVWDTSKRDINTGVVLVNLYNQALNETPQIVVPVSVYVSVPSNTSLIKGSVTVPLKSIHDSNVLEDCISVHRIEAKEGQTPFLNFQPLEDPSYKIQIVLTVGVRPLLEHFKKYSESIPRSVPSGETQDNLTVFVDGVSTQERSWFYLGILPHPDTLQNVSVTLGTNTNFTVRYAFHVKIINCHLWNMTNMRWSSENCKPGPETTPEKLHCLSTHLSVFSGTILASPNKLDLFQSIPMLLYSSENTMIPIFVASIFSLYLIILIWARSKDKRDIDERIVTVLEDNYPGSSYTYLIGVYTGWKWNAGTTANVGIQLIGDKSRSKIHILKDSTRTVHARNSDNWFVIFSAKELGELQLLRLWHDNSGHFPPWYCDRVVVKDIQKDITWIFLVQRWLSVIHQGANIYCSLPPASLYELQKKSLLVKDNLKLGILEQHIWINMFTRHPWSTYTRVQRITVTLNILLSTMLISLLMFDIPRGDIDDKIDEPSFLFPGKEFGLVVLAALMTIPLHFMLVLLFRKTAPREIKYNPNAKAFLVEGKRKKENSKWWKFFMFEPLVHPAKTKESENDVDLEIFVKSSKSMYDEAIKQEFKTTQYLFPSWVIFLAWMLCSLLIIVCVTLLILLGLMFAEVKSEVWLVAVFLYILFSILILQPLKVVVFSLILSYLIREESSNFQEVDIFFTKAAKDQEKLDRKLTLEVRRLRKLQMYRPLKAAELLKLKRLERTRAKLADLFIDLCMFVVYIVTLYWLVLGTRDELAYYSTSSLKKSIILDDFSELKSGKQFITYMNTTFLPALHAEQWYNGEKINITAVTNLYDTRLLGLVRLRQIRIRNVTCEFVQEIEMFVSTCNAEFSPGYEETNDYDVGWKPFNTNAYRSTRLTQPWIYSSAWDTGTVPVDGTFTIYPGGGHVCTLGRTLKNSLLTFNFLAENDWFDPLTRAVFIEFTLYNANRNIFNIVTLLVEIGATGAMTTTTDIRSLKLLLKIEELGPSVLTALILWMLVLLVFTIRQMNQFGRISTRSYFNSWWNIIDVIILSLAICTVIFYLLRSKYVSHLIKELEEADGNEFVNFMWAGYWQVQLWYLMAALVCLSTARLWKLLRFQHQFRNFERTLVHASYTLFFVVFMMFIIITACACFSYLFISYTSAVFSTILSSYAEMLSYGLGFSHLDDNEFYNQQSFIGHTYILIVWLLYVVYLVNLFITVINFSYEESQKEKSIFQEDYTLLDYVKDELEYLCKCRKHGSDLQSSKGKRLSAHEKYPHYFHNFENKKQNNSPSKFRNVNDNESIHTGEEDALYPGSTQTQIYHFVQKKNTNWPVNELRSHVLDTQYIRFRAGADVLLEPVYAPALAVSKPDEIRYDNVEKISQYRLEAMRNLALVAIKVENMSIETRLHAMASIIQDCMTMKHGNDLFYRGLDGDKQKFVSEDKLIQMEKVVNKFGAEIYLREMGDDTAEADSDDLDIDYDTDYVGHADVLTLQMVRLHKIISSWKPKPKKTPEREGVTGEESKIEVGYKKQMEDEGKYIDSDKIKKEDGVVTEILDKQEETIPGKRVFDQIKSKKRKRARSIEKQISDEIKNGGRIEDKRTIEKQISVEIENGGRIEDKRKNKKIKGLPKEEHDIEPMEHGGGQIEVGGGGKIISDKTLVEGRSAIEPGVVATRTKPKQFKKTKQGETKIPADAITPLQSDILFEDGREITDEAKAAAETETEYYQNIPAEEESIIVKGGGIAYLSKNGAIPKVKVDKQVPSGKDGKVVAKEFEEIPKEEETIIVEKKDDLFLQKDGGLVSGTTTEQKYAKHDQREDSKRPKHMAKKKILKKRDALDDHVLSVSPAPIITLPPFLASIVEEEQVSDKSRDQIEALDDHKKSFRKESDKSWDQSEALDDQKKSFRKESDKKLVSDKIRDQIEDLDDQKKTFRKESDKKIISDKSKDQIEALDDRKKSFRKESDKKLVSDKIRDQIEALDDRKKSFKKESDKKLVSDKSRDQIEALDDRKKSFRKESDKKLVSDKIRDQIEALDDRKKSLKKESDKKLVSDKSRDQIEALDDQKKSFKKESDKKLVSDKSRDQIEALDDQKKSFKKESDKKLVSDKSRDQIEALDDQKKSFRKDSDKKIISDKSKDQIEALDDRKKSFRKESDKKLVSDKIRDQIEALDDRKKSFKKESDKKLVSDKSRDQTEALDDWKKSFRKESDKKIISDKSKDQIEALDDRKKGFRKEFDKQLVSDKSKDQIEALDDQKKGLRKESDKKLVSDKSKDQIEALDDRKKGFRKEFDKKLVSDKSRDQIEALDDQKKGFRKESDKKLVSDKSRDQIEALDDQKKSFKKESDKKLVSDKSRDQIEALDDQKKSFRKDSDKKIISDKSKDQIEALDDRKKSFRKESDKKLVSDKIRDQIEALDDRKKSFKKESDKKLVSDKSRDQIEALDDWKKSFRKESDKKIISDKSKDQIEALDDRKKGFRKEFDKQLVSDKSKDQIEALDVQKKGLRKESDKKLVSDKSKDQIEALDDRKKGFRKEFDKKLVSDKSRDQIEALDDQKKGFRKESDKKLVSDKSKDQIEALDDQKKGLRKESDKKLVSDKSKDQIEALYDRKKGLRKESDKKLVSDKSKDLIETLDDRKKSFKKESDKKPKKKLSKKDNVVDGQEPTVSAIARTTGIVPTPVAARGTSPNYERDFCALFPVIHPRDISQRAIKNNDGKENSKPNTLPTSPREVLPDQTGKIKHAVFPIEPLVYHPFINNFQTQSQSADVRIQISEHESDLEEANSSELEERNFNSDPVPVNQFFSSLTEVVPSLDHLSFIPYESITGQEPINNRSRSNESTFNSRSMAYESHFINSLPSTSSQDQETNNAHRPFHRTSSTDYLPIHLYTEYEASSTQISSHNSDFVDISLQNHERNAANAFLERTMPQRVPNYGAVSPESCHEYNNNDQERYVIVPINDCHVERELDHQEQQDMRMLTQGVFTRAERPLEEESRLRNGISPSLPVQRLCSPEMSSVVSPRHMSASGLTRQEVQYRRDSGDDALRSSQISTRRSFETENEEIRICKSRETSPRDDRTVTDSNNNINAGRPPNHNVISNLTGLDELRVTVHLNNGRVTVEDHQSQTDQQERGHNVARNDREEAQSHERIQREFSEPRTQHEFNGISSSSRCSRTSRHRKYLRSSRCNNSTRQFCFMPEIFYPFQTGYYFPYANVPYFTPPFMFHSSYLHPAYFLDVYEDPTSVHLVPEEMQRDANPQGRYVPFQRYDRLGHVGASRMENNSVSRAEEHHLFHQGWPTRQNTQAECFDVQSGVDSRNNSFQQGRRSTSSGTSRQNMEAEILDVQSGVDSRNNFFQQGRRSTSSGTSRQNMEAEISDVQSGVDSRNNSFQQGRHSTSSGTSRQNMEAEILDIQSGVDSRNNSFQQGRHSTSSGTSRQNMEAEISDVQSGVDSRNNLFQQGRHSTSSGTRRQNMEAEISDVQSGVDSRNNSFQQGRRSTSSGTSRQNMEAEILDVQSGVDSRTEEINQFQHGWHVPLSRNSHQQESGRNRQWGRFRRHRGYSGGTK